MTTPSRTAIRHALRTAGYGLVQFEPQLRGISNLPDVLAWASNADGELVPWAVVEVKSGPAPHPDLALPALARSRELLGTADHYALIDGQWFKADGAVKSLDAVEGPSRPAYGTGGYLSDPDLATSLLLERLWFEANVQRGQSQGNAKALPSAEVLSRSDFHGIHTADSQYVPVRPDVLWHATRRALVEYVERDSRAGGGASEPLIAQAVAALVGDRLGRTVVDPFCGTGSFLWAVMDRASRLNEPLTFLGVELNARLAELARAIGRAAPFRSEVRTGDAFLEPLPQADVVVSAPPTGLRLPAPVPLLDGSTATDIDAAAIDLALRHLVPGGRAVLHVSAAFASRVALEPYRRYLANSVHVNAVIALPAGAMFGTSTPSVLVVIDKEPPGLTFVAQLGEDWRSQLEPSGAALTAAVQHCDGGTRTLF